MCLRQVLRPLMLYTDPQESNASKVTLLGSVKVKTGQVKTESGSRSKTPFVILGP